MSCLLQAVTNPNLADLLTQLDKSVEEQDSVPDLPDIPQLQHLAKARPKRPKKHASKSSGVRLEGEAATTTAAGLDTFFTTPAPQPAKPQSPLPKVGITGNMYLYITCQFRNTVLLKSSFCLSIL